MPATGLLIDSDRMRMKPTTVDDTFKLPLFPLQTVLFPGGLLNLKVFESRYLDLITSCLRTRTPFGVITTRGTQRSNEISSHAAEHFETVGTLAELIGVDSDQPGILHVRCVGTQRFEVLSTAQQANDLWAAAARLVEDDEVVAPSTALQGSVKALSSAISSLQAQNESPFLEPHHLDNAGWVANRWCEILPISQSAKQKLMELPDPEVRLQLVDEFLRSKGLLT
jgi:uncharacterized protein